MSDSLTKVFLRDEIGNYIVELGKKDKDVVVVNADLMGTCRNRSFVERFPNRSFNVGIAEQNMISFASGLAREGFKAYTFSMAPFISLRACEQLRTDVAYENLNVRFMAIYAGLSGGISGVTHWSIEDCAIMNAIPNMTVIEICDSNQARALLDKSLTHKGPIYFRSGVLPVFDVYSEDDSFDIGGSKEVCSGNDGAFLCSGVTVGYAKKASEIIKEKHNKNIRVVDLYSLKPIDEKAIIDAAKTNYVVCAQDHNIKGGLASMASDVIVNAGVCTHFKALGVPDEFVAMAHAPYLYNKFGYDTDGLVKAMEELMGI